MRVTKVPFSSHQQFLGRLRDRLSTRLPADQLNAVSDGLLLNTLVIVHTYGKVRPTILHTDITEYRLAKGYDDIDPFDTLRTIVDRVSAALLHRDFSDFQITAAQPLADYFHWHPRDLYDRYHVEPREKDGHRQLEVGCGLAGLELATHQGMVFIDANPFVLSLILHYAEIHGVKAEIHQRDVLHKSKQKINPGDVVRCSFFLHMFSSEQIPVVLSFMRDHLYPQGSLHITEPERMCCHACPSKIALIRDWLNKNFMVVEEEPHFSHFAFVPIPGAQFTASRLLALQSQ